MTELEDAINIGAVLARELRAAGISSLEELTEVGAISAVHRLRKANPDRDCMSSAFAIAGAIAGVRWHHLPQAAKDQIRRAFGSGASRT